MIRRQCSSALFRAKKNGRGFRPPLAPPDSGGEFRSSSPPEFLPCKRPSAERGGVRGGLKKRLKNLKSTKISHKKSIPVRYCVDLWFNNLFGYGIRKQCSSALFRAKKTVRGFRPPLAPPDSKGEFRSPISPPELGGARGGLNKLTGRGFRPPLTPPDQGENPR